MHKAGQISQTTIEIIIVIGIVIMINVLGQFFYSRLDLTDDQRYTLADSSKRVVSELEERLYLKVYLTTDLPPEYQAVKERLTDLLEEYSASGSTNFVVQYIDPDDLEEEDRAALELKGIVEQIYQTRGADAYGERRAYFDVEIEYVGVSEVIPTIPQQQNLEYEITSAIIKLTSESQPTVGFLTGHGELSREQEFSGLSEYIADILLVQDVDISSGRHIPDNIDVLVIARPMTEYTEREQYVIDQFVMKGGRLVFFSTGVEMDQMSSQAVFRQVPLDNLLAAYGVKINNDLVVDPEFNYKVAIQAQGGFRILKYGLFPLVMEQLDGFPSGSPATRGIGALAFLNISSIDVLYDVVPDETEVMELIKTSESSYRYDAPINLDPTQDFALLGGDDVTRELVGVQLNGIFTSAFAGQSIPAIPGNPNIPDSLPEIDSEPMIETSESTSVVVIGSGDFFSQGHSQTLDQMRNFNGFRPSNEVFVINLLETLSMGDELIDIRTRSVTPRPLNPELTAGEMNGMKFWAYVFVPLGIIILGIGRFYLKSQRKRLMAAYLQADASEKKSVTGITKDKGGEDE